MDPERSRAQRRKNPWNTTYRGGLPMTPIANPSKKALIAAARPASSRALFMVPRGDGTHVFCEDRECFVASWERWVKDGNIPPLPRRFR